MNFRLLMVLFALHTIHALLFFPLLHFIAGYSLNHVLIFHKHQFTDFIVECSNLNKYGMERDNEKEGGRNRERTRQ